MNNQLKAVCMLELTQHALAEAAADEGRAAHDEGREVNEALVQCLAQYARAAVLFENYVDGVTGREGGNLLSIMGDLAEEEQKAREAFDGTGDA